MPETSEKIFKQINAKETSYESIKEFGKTEAATVVGKPEVLFARIDEEKMMEEINKDIENEKKQEEVKKEEVKEEKVNLISFDDFMKVELKSAKILEVEKVEGTDKLLKIEVDLGNETRTIVSGIAKYYTKEDLVGKNIVVCTNLKPVKLRGILSSGMLLAAGEDPDVKLLMLDDTVKPGTSIH